MRTGHKVEKGKTGKHTLYIRLTRRDADNNIGDGAGDKLDEIRDTMLLGAVSKVSNGRSKECCEN